ncbi:hypothetical protein ILYODFUR_039020 [Ilyodon furcidens]|uniref:Uncharacterized protein n=1 Tax=Ilyodon furcidens TaxID=33524 RepID=A0ABV0TS79_9TELE
MKTKTQTPKDHNRNQVSVTPLSASSITIPLMEALGVRVRYWSAARVFHLCSLCPNFIVQLRHSLMTFISESESESESALLPSSCIQTRNLTPVHFALLFCFCIT